MPGQISGLSLELVAVVVAASMLLGAVDILRQPGWAWKQAGEPQVAYLILDLILPIIGVAMYAFRARPKVVAEAANGPAAASADATPAKDTPAKDTPAKTGPTGPAGPTVGAGTDPFTSFREMADDGYGSRADPQDQPSPSGAPEQFEISSTFFSTGASTRNLRHPLALARAYRPRQRTSLTEDQPETAAEEVADQEVADQPEPEQAQAQAVDLQPEPTPVVEIVPDPAPVAEVEPEPAQPQAQAQAARPEAVAPLFHAAPTVPSGWKVDPTGRHQFRYWDGFTWTENVADDGEEALDAVSA